MKNTNQNEANTYIEKRENPRFQINLPVRYKYLGKNELSGPFESVSENLSIGGIAVVGSEQLAFGQELELTIFIIPKDRFSEEDNTQAYPKEECIPVQVISRVAWCNSYEGSKYIYGIEFIDIESKDSIHLEEFLEEYKTINQNRPGVLPV